MVECARTLLPALLIAAGAVSARAESNFEAANGPLSGDVALFAREQACAEALKTPGYFQSINAAELADSERSGTYPCATFTGAFDGPNRVFAWRSQDAYQGVSFINNRKPSELYLVGGDLPKIDGPSPPGPFVAKADATTGKEIWRTYLDNINVSGRWIAVENLNILPNGNIVFGWSDYVALIDGDTGRILRTQTLPTGPAAVEDANFKHVTVAPDGTIILKDQLRPAGEKGQGAFAIMKGVEAGLK
jgi:outer membrane protein assembly factor BamB